MVTDLTNNEETEVQEPVKAKKAKAVKVDTERKEAPSITADSPTFADQRIELEDKYDAVEPEFKHVYQILPEADGEQRDQALGIIKSKGMEVVDEQTARHGGDVLCRIPKKTWDDRKSREMDISMSAVKRIASDERMLSKTASPVIPKAIKKQKE